MENQVKKQNPKQKKKVITKVVCVVIAILLMVGIAFIVANYVHKNNALPASADVKNGLSAYELAVEQGYNGSLEEWLKSLDGKSAYEIAVDNGYSGTEDEWNKAIANVSQNNVTIKNAEFSKNGNLIITLSDETIINVGKVVGSDGKDGANGKNGTNGKNGADGKSGRDGANGINGKDGKNGADGKDGVNGTNGVNGKDGINGVDGQDGKGISSASINENGQLLLTFSDGSTVNLDKIVGTNGVDGQNGKDGLNGKDGRDGVDGAKGDKGDKGDAGADGKNGLDGRDGVNGTDGLDGVGISTIVVTDDGNLDITLSNGTTLNLGTIKGADGTGIKSVTLSTGGELIITLSDNSVLNLGNVKGEKGDKGDKGDTGTDGKDGKDGRGIAKTELVNDELIITYTDGTSDNLGKIGSDETKEPEHSYDDISIGSIVENGSEYRYLTVSLSNNNTESINIPTTMYTSEYGYLPVVMIFDNDFESTALKSVALPKHCAIIEENTFSKCPNLNEVYFEVTAGWKNSETGEEISESTMADPRKAADFLRQGVGLSHARIY